MNRNNCLLAEELKDVFDIFIDCYEATLEPLFETNNLHVQEKVISFATTTRLYTLFTDVSLVATVDFVFDDIIFRDFILNLSDKFNIITSVSDIDESRSLESSIAFGISMDIDSEYILVPEKVLANLQVNITDIYNVLSHNKWLTVLVLLVILFNRTSTFLSFVKK